MDETSKEYNEADHKELGSLDTDVATSELNTIDVEQPIPRAGSTAAEIDTVTDSQKLMSVIIDSSTGIVVWSSALAPDTPTEDSEESLSGGKYDDPGDKEQVWTCSRE